MSFRDRGVECIFISHGGHSFRTFAAVLCDVYFNSTLAHSPDINNVYEGRLCHSFLFIKGVFVYGNTEMYSRYMRNTFIFIDKSLILVRAQELFTRHGYQSVKKQLTT